MNAYSPIPQKKRARVFTSNRSQAVRIPKELAFPDDVKDVYVIRRGKRLEIIPVDSLWDDFFDRPPCPDFMEPEDLPPQERDFG
jgi:antitoxin VapB